MILNSDVTKTLWIRCKALSTIFSNQIDRPDALAPIPNYNYNDEYNSGPMSSDAFAKLFNNNNNNNVNENQITIRESPERSTLLVNQMDLVRFEIYSVFFFS